MYKLNKNGGIVRLADGASIPIDERNRDYQEYMVWLDAGNTPEPYIASLEDAQGELLRQVNFLCDQKMTTLKGGYPEEEIKTWNQQVREAELYHVDPLATVPMLTAMSTARDLPKDVLASRIMTKASAFAGLAGQIVGRRQKLEDDIAAATTLAEAGLLAETILIGWPV